MGIAPHINTVKNYGNDNTEGIKNDFLYLKHDVAFFLLKTMIWNKALFNYYQLALLIFNWFSKLKYTIFISD